MDKAALATETASKAMQKSAKEFEKTNLMFQADTPAMITEIEAAAQQYKELGQTLNLMTAGKSYSDLTGSCAYAGFSLVSRNFAMHVLRLSLQFLVVLTADLHHHDSHACSELRRALSFLCSVAKPCLYYSAGFRGKNPVQEWSELSMKRVAKDVSALTNVGLLVVACLRSPAIMGLLVLVWPPPQCNYGFHSCIVKCGFTYLHACLQPACR